MRIAYFDCFCGISGDMILGALIDAGLPLGDLETELAKLNLSGYTMEAIQTRKGEISATKFHVSLSHDHHHRSLRDIFEIIDESGLPNDVKEGSKAIFSRLAEAEARIHKQPVDEVHFHETGAVDAIIDIVGAVIGITKMAIDDVWASRLHVGSGFIECAHGTLPAPAPATLELLKGIPVYSTGVTSELVTPTGAAIVSTLCRNFGEIPPMRIDMIGYGAGARDLSVPNVLRVLIGTIEEGFSRYGAESSLQQMPAAGGHPHGDSAQTPVSSERHTPLRDADQAECH